MNKEELIKKIKGQDLEYTSGCIICDFDFEQYDFIINIALLKYSRSQDRKIEDLFHVHLLCALDIEQDIKGFKIGEGT